MQAVEKNLRRLAGALMGQAVDDDPDPFVEIGADIEDETRGALVMAIINEANHLREMQGGSMVVLPRAFLELVAETLQSIIDTGHMDEVDRSRLHDLHNLLSRALQEN